MLLVKPSAKDPNEVVEAIKAYSEQKKWQYIGASQVKKCSTRMPKWKKR